jgi:hypothetical protein
VFDFERFCADNGYEHARLLPDGRVLAVSSMTFGNYRLVVGDAYQVLDGY